jgi:hypothetical protein
MTDYEQGQIDLIQHIKDEVLKIEEQTDGVDIMIDIIYLLKGLETRIKNK